MPKMLKSILMWVLWLWLVSYNVFLSKVLWETWDRVDTLLTREERPSIYIEKATIYGGESEIYVATKGEAHVLRKD